MPRQAKPAKEGKTHKAKADGDGDLKAKATGDGNGFNGRAMMDYIAEIEAEQAMIDAIMQKARDDAEPRRQEIAKLIKAAADDGFPKTEFKLILKERRLKEKLATLDKTLDDGEKANFVAMKAALGPFAETELGAAALADAAAKAGIDPAEAATTH